MIILFSHQPGIRAMDYSNPTCHGRSGRVHARVGLSYWEDSNPRLRELAKPRKPPCVPKRCNTDNICNLTAPATSKLADALCYAITSAARDRVCIGLRCKSVVGFLDPSRSTNYRFDGYTIRCIDRLTRRARSVGFCIPSHLQATMEQGGGQGQAFPC